MEIKLEKVYQDRFYPQKLYKDYIFNFEKVFNFYQYDFRKISEYFKRASDIYNDYDRTLRSTVSSILKKYNHEHGCHAKTLENINSLEDEKSLIVIGGHQPGLLVSPIFIVYKILTILKLSSFLEKELGVKVIPCLWNASDDGNLASIKVAKILNRNLEEISLNLNHIREDTRYSNIFLPASSFRKVIEELSNVLTLTEYKDKVINFLYDCVCGSFISPSSFFSTIVLKMFGKYGLVVVDPAIGEFKKLSYKFLELDIKNHKSIKDIILARGNNLKKAGYHSQLNLENEILDFFLVSDGKRERIRAREKGIFEIGGTTMEECDLLDYIKSNIGNISLNVVLRPIFQDSVLPVVASVCGPGEISYFAQLKEVYDLFNVKLPIIYPRFSATIIERKVEKAMERTGISFAELEMDKERVLVEVIKRNLNLDLDSLLFSFENEVYLKLQALEREVLKTKMSSVSSFDRIKRNLGKEINVLRKKLFSEYKKQNDYLASAVDKVFFNIFPNQNLQEREISVWGYINKYGFELIDKIYEEIVPFDFGHKFLKIV